MKLRGVQLIWPSGGVGLMENEVSEVGMIRPWMRFSQSSLIDARSPQSAQRMDDEES